MVTLRVYLLFLINVNTFHGKSIMFNRRSMNSEPSPNKLVYPRTQMRFGKGEGFEKQLETQIGSGEQTDLAARMISTTNFKKKKVYRTTPLNGRRGESDKLRQRRRTRTTTTTTTTPTTTTSPYTIKYLDTDPPTKRRLWTTSLGPLELMLSKKLPFFDPAPDQVGILNKGIMYPVTQPLWIFEGYDDASAVVDILREEYRTCESQIIRCLADTEYNQPVCVVDLTMEETVLPQYRNKGFHSQCEVAYRNCLKRFEITGKYYADSYQEDYLDFLHYGWCENCNLFSDINCTANRPNTILTPVP